MRLPSRLGVLGAFMALMLLVAPAAAATSTGLNLDSEKTPNPTLYVTYEKASHNMSHSQNVLDYQDDDGNWQTLNGSLDNVSNPITIEATNIDRAAAYPSDANSTLSPDSYTLSGNTSKVNLSASSGDVGGLVVDASQIATGDSVTATMANVSETSDVNKRVFHIVGSVAELNGTAEVRAIDTDGDYVALTLDSASATDSAAVLAGETGSSFVAQQKVGDLAVQGSGDGVMNEIASTAIVAQNGSVQATFTTISFDRLSKVKYGVEQTDTDGDGTTEPVDVYEPTGAYSIESLESLDSVFAEATIYGVQFEYAQDASAGSVSYEYDAEAAEEYNNYDYVFRMYADYELVSAMDLEVLSAELTDTVVFPTTRLLDAKYIEGAGSSSYDSLADSSAWSDLTDEYDAAGDNASVSIDSTIQESTRYVVFQSWLVDEDDKTDQTAEGGIGGPMSAVGNGILGFLGSLPGIVVSGIVGYGVVFKNWLGRLFAMLSGFVSGS